ncbi:sigma-70 family RNA polymerase sigma factor [bacterium]|nr:sigma-70 family RNA polymerase sigma factor [bacterium]
MSKLTPAEEKQLIERAVKGDQQAFARLVSATKNLVYSCCIRVLRNPEQAEEAANEALLRAWRGLPSFRGEARFSSWIYRIARNVAVRMATKRRLKTVSLDDEERPQLAQAAREESRAEQRFEDQDKLAILRELMQELPENQCRALELAYLEGISYTDVAATLGCAIGTVKTWVHRGRIRLRELFEERMEEL